MKRWWPTPGWLAFLLAGQCLISSLPAQESPSATLVLRVEGPAAIEIQHQSAVIVERVNRYFGWQALAGIALRQAPLARRRAKPARTVIDQELADAISSRMTGIADDGLRAALGRLGAAIKRT